jgi:hypothetical protein
VNVEQNRGYIPSRVTIRVTDELDTLEQKFGNVWSSCADSHFLITLAKLVQSIRSGAM